ncbi:MAG: hypothetical protein ACRD3E_07945 [Terriglobales bacterium]
MSAQAQLSTSTTLSQQTANNTSASAAFAGQPNGNPAAANISKLPIRSLLYPGATTRIYAHVEPWWGSGSHVNIGYNSQDSAEVHSQVQDMVSRGIDGAVVDWYGPGSYEDTGVKLLVAEAEATPNFSVIVEIDVGAINWHSCYPGCSATTAAINLFTAANSEFLASPAIARWNGRTVVMEFGFSTLSLPTGAATGWNVVDWNAVQTQVPGNVAFVHRNLGGYGMAQSTGAFTWMEPETLSNFTAGFDDTIELDWFYSNTLKTYPSMTSFGAVWKGFDDTIASWSPAGGRHIDQNCGQTWLNTFAKINQYYSPNNQLPALQLVTWNDYEEGTEVETGIDNCVTVSATLNASQLNWTVTGNEQAVDHYTVFASPDGTGLASLGDFGTDTHGLDLSSFTLPAGTYSIYVQAVGMPSVQNHISTAVSYTVAPPPPPPAPTPTPSPTPTPTVQKAVSLSATPPAQTVTVGQAGKFTLTVAQTGATDPVQLSCSGLPAGVSCNFSASTVTPDAAGTQVQLSVATGAVSAANHQDAPALAALFGGLGLFGMAGAPGVLRRRKVAALAFLALLLLSQIACGGGGAAVTTSVAPSKPPTVTTATTYTITVNAVSGTVAKTTIVSLTVN